MNTYTEAEALNHHGIGVGLDGDALTDAARQAGIISACLGCGTVVGMADPIVVCGAEVTDPVRREITRKAYAAHYDFSCCPDSDDILY